MNDKIRILYIDDNPFDRALVRHALEKEHIGFILTEAQSQSEFENLIQNEDFDLVLTDFNILGYEGLQVLDYVNAHFPHIPVIIVTGTGSEEVAVEAMKRQAADYVIKTASHLGKLPQTIMSVLELRKIRNDQAVTHRELIKMNRVYAVISQINQMIVRTKESETVFQEACNIAVKYGNFRFAWVGLVDHDSDLVRPYCWAGYEDGYLTYLKAEKAEATTDKRGPREMSIRTGKYSVCNDIAIDPIMEPWREEALKRGYRSIISLPIKPKKKIIGNFNIYFGDPNFFDEQEVELLNEVAEDISFALESIQKEVDRELAEESLLKSENLFRNVFEHSVEGKSLTSISGEMRVNKAFSEITGYSEDELAKIKWTDITHKDDIDHNTRVINLLLSGAQSSARWEKRYIHKNGNVVWVDIGTALEKDGDGKPLFFITSIVDITEKKQWEQDLIIARDKAEESDRLKTAFLTNMSHEIRTPMNGILGFTGLLKTPELFGEKQQKYIRIIEKSGARMLNTINDIIDISKIESGEKEVNETEININDLIENTCTFFSIEAEEKGLKLSYYNDLKEEEAFVYTDEVKLNRILNNLVKNAIKFTDAGKIEFGYVLKSDSEHTELEFFIKDTGIGIPEGRQVAVFERFIQADITDRRAFQGSGLGLSISKAYVEMLGGRIWLESEAENLSLGKAGYANFYFTIPYAKISKNEVMSDETLNVPGEIKFDNLVILIAEDDKTSAMLLAEMLKDYSRELLFTETGRETVKLCSQRKDIDIVLMDIQMPDLNGYKATEQIREFNKEVIIIAQTAFALIGDKEKATRAGCSDYIAKPIDVNLLKEKIENHLGKSRTA